MKFYTTTNEDFAKTSRQTHDSRFFCMIKVLKVFDKGLMTGMILVNLQKAFDTIDHDMILKKLSGIGFSNHTIGWLKSNLSNWLFRVNLENVIQNLSIPHVGYHKVPFWDLYCFSYKWMTCRRLLNQICFYMLMTLALFFRERML